LLGLKRPGFDVDHSPREMLYVYKHGHTYDKLTFTLSATIRCDSSSNKWLSTNGPVKRRTSLRMENRVSGCEIEKKGYVQEDRLKKNAK
jgi:hypothetical protein